jgi:hypothetical protein
MRSATRGKVFKRILIGGLVLLVAVILLAEIGVVKLETTETSWKTESQYKTSRETLHRRPVLLQGFRFAPTVKVTVPSGPERLSPSKPPMPSARHLLLVSARTKQSWRSQSAR